MGAYPYISRRLLTDTSPRLRAALKYMVYGQSERFDVDRVIDMLGALERFAAVKKLADRDVDIVISESRETGLVREADAPILDRSIVPQDEDAARDALAFFFGEDGEVFREFLLDELVKSIDAGARATLTIPRPPLASPRVTTFLAKLQPTADDDDRAAIENARKLVAFLLRNDDNADLSSVAPSRTSASVLRQLRALLPVVNERRDDLRLFGTKLAARLAEKQLARNFDALGSLIAPATSR